MRSASQRLRRLVEHPATRVAVASILLVSGFAESYGTIVEDLTTFCSGCSTCWGPFQTFSRA